MIEYLYWVSHISYLYDGLLLIFTLSATMLGAITVSNAMRLRNVQMSWNGGHLRGYPLISTIFLLFTLFLLLVTFWREPQSLVKVAAYNWIGINWFLVSHLSAKVYISDYGVVKNVNDPSQTIAWHQVIDLVEREEEGETVYTFLYFNKQKGYSIRDKRKCVRLELVIPSRKKKAFRKILSFKLGRRFNCKFTQQQNIKNFNNLA
jgi:hypothetical protein